MSFFRYVEFDKFMLNELGEAIGVNGYIWPSKKRVSCKINIEDLSEENRLKVDLYQIASLEKGAMLALTLDASDGGLLVRKLKIVTTTLEESCRFMRRGYGFVYIRTPFVVKRKIADLADGSGWNPNIEKQIAEHLRGVSRYLAQCVIFAPEAIISSRQSSATSIAKRVAVLYQRAYQERSRLQLMVIREAKSKSLHLQQVFPWNNLLPHDHKNVSEGIIQEHVGLVLSRLPRNIDYWLFPAFSYTVSPHFLELGSERDSFIFKVFKTARAGLLVKEKGSVERLTRQIGLRLSPGGSGVVVDIMYDERDKPLSVIDLFQLTYRDF